MQEKVNMINFKTNNNFTNSISFASKISLNQIDKRLLSIFNIITFDDVYNLIIKLISFSAISLHKKLH